MVYSDDIFSENSKQVDIYSEKRIFLISNLSIESTKYPRDHVSRKRDALYKRNLSDKNT